MHLLCQIAWLSLLLQRPQKVPSKRLQATVVNMHSQYAEWH